MENEKEDLIFSLTENDLQEIAEKVFETTLFDDHIEYIKSIILGKDLSDFVSGLVFKSLVHFQTIEKDMTAKNK